MNYNTETAGTGKYLNDKRIGFYNCKTCYSPLFASESKFDSGSGWPSFHNAIPGSVIIRDDNGSDEVVCAICERHLGHRFNDGPIDKRYCINSKDLLHSEDDIIGN